MNFSSLINITKKPPLYEKGNAVMWTEDYISKQLLNVHLNTQTELASRKPENIERTIDWILSDDTKKPLRILDLGCGPGLYAEKLAQLGHRVTGVDFSANSIEYAKNEAKKKQLNIEYLNEDYLSLDLDENYFDLVLLIYTDFGPLLPGERDELLSFVKKVLKPGGQFIFDVLSDATIKDYVTPKSWDVSQNGFWKSTPNMVLSEAFLYEEHKVILYQHSVIDESENLNIYRFWTHFFSDDDLIRILNPHGFGNLKFDKDVLMEAENFEGTNVTFCKAEKSK